MAQSSTPPDLPTQPQVRFQPGRTLHEWVRCFEQRKAGRDYRVFFVLYTALIASLLHLLNTAALLIIPEWQWMIVAVAGTMTLFTLWSQYRIAQRRHGDGWVGLRVGLTFSIPLMSYALLMGFMAAHPLLGQWLVLLPTGLIVIWIAAVIVVTQRTWPFEIGRGEVYYYLPVFSPRHQLRAAMRPRPRIAQSVIQALLDFGMPQDLIDTYLAHSIPQSMHGAIHSALALGIIEAQLACGAQVMAQQHGSAPGNLHTLSPEDRMQVIHTYCPPERQQQIAHDARQALQQFLHAAATAPPAPVLWIDPRDTIGLFWDLDALIPVSLTLDNVLTQHSIAFSMTLSYVLMPDPRRVTEPEVLNRFARTPSVEAQRQQLAAVFSKPTERAAREFFMERSFAEVFTTRCLRELRQHLAQQVLVGIAAAQGVQVLETSIDYWPALLDRTAQAGRDASAEMVKLEAYVTKLRELSVPDSVIMEFVYSRGMVKEMPSTTGEIASDFFKPSYPLFGLDALTAAPAKPSLIPPQTPKKSNNAISDAEYRPLALDGDTPLDINDDW